MGCAPSKSRESKLVDLCRRRRDLLAAATTKWRALGASHVAHLQSLRRLSDALVGFAEDDLKLAPTPMARSLTASPEDSHLHLSESEGSHLRISSDEEEVDARKSPSLRSTPRFPNPDPRPSLHYVKRSNPLTRSSVYQPPPSVHAIGSGSGGESWDFWDPFRSYDQIQQRHRLGSAASSVSSREVRMREGIPDLETETDSEFAKGSERGRKSSPLMRRSRPFVVKGGNKGKEIVSSPECFFSVCSDRGSNSGDSDEDCILTESVGGEEFAETKGRSFEVGTSCTSERSGPSYEATLAKEGTRNVWDIVREIAMEFEVIVKHGEGLSMVLEVDKLHHRSRSKGSRFTVVSSRIPDSLSMMVSSLHPLIYSRHQNRTSYGDSRNLLNTRTHGILLSLEELYLWQRKMYQEVKNAEKLHMMYEKKFNQQTVLRGRAQSQAESNKCYQKNILTVRKSHPQEVESLQISLNKLHVKIDIAVKSVDFISCRIEKLRDEELQPHLVELIQCLMGTWKSVLASFKRQYQAILDCRTSNLVARTSIEKKNMVAKASRKLEKGIHSWSSCFYEWSRAQKAYIAALNKWLLSCVNTEPEITVDGVAPFSPARAGAPSTVVICDDWHRAMNGIREDRVLTALEDFARNVHNLHEIQHKEQRLRLKTESLSRDIAKLNSMEKDRVNHLETESSERRTIYLFKKLRGSRNNAVDGLESLKYKYVKEKAKHKETLNQMHEMAGSVLRAGLIPVFEQLVLFMMDMIKAYERLRIPRLDGHSKPV